MKKFLFILLLFISFTALAQSKDEAAVRQVMALQEQAWNRGDLEAFMQGYWKSDFLQFVGKNGITYGWEKTFSNYKRSYPDTATMGKLRFDILEIRRLSVMYFFVIGKWHLSRNSLDDIGGHFTLVFRKIKNKWVIITDHTS